MGVFPMIQQTVTILPFSVSSTAFMEGPMVVVYCLSQSSLMGPYMASQLLLNTNVGIL
jgi:hypothetical protein